MATIVFSALGTLVGGPIGGMVGALLGREADRAIIGTPVREGARLTELAVTSSTYGQPLPRLYGTTRAAGTILWATEMKESSETVGGGKGQPKTRQYSYSISLAVALSSRPIAGLGRIWADGNLLRGEAGDMKTGGALRIYLGHADQMPDPLLAGALGAQCPAHRGLAYVVFEDLQLADFGNRVPALSFEVFASGGGVDLMSALAQDVAVAIVGNPVPIAAPIAGFAQEGGSMAQVFDLLGQVVPLVARDNADGLAIGAWVHAATPPTSPAAIAWPDGDFGQRTGAQRARGVAAAPGAIRYYDSARDYQPGLQRVTGRARAGGERVLELPATMAADGAQAMIDGVRRRQAAGSQRLRLRVAALDPATTPGNTIGVRGEGVWRVAAWEWRDGGVELDLLRPEPGQVELAASDPGTAWRPLDRLPAATVIDAFELPWDGAGSPDAVRVHAAVGAGPGRWAGAALYVERGGALVPIASADPRRAVTGALRRPLGPSPALMFESAAVIELQCDDPDCLLESVDAASLAAGGNRVLIGSEIVQFLSAEPIGGGGWRLTGLLRGRGATEREARAGHTTGVRVCLLDDRIQLLDGAAFDPATERLAAIGVGDAAPGFATVREPGRSRRPLSPVHATALVATDGALVLAWTRRARGAWGWSDGVEVPLIEEVERYEVGAGPLDAPLRRWEASEPRFIVPANELADLDVGTPLWVRQVGTHGVSDPTTIHSLV